MRPRNLVVLVVTLALGTPATAAQPAPSFGRRALAPKVQPTQSVVADLNADHLPDVVTAVGLSSEGQEVTRGVSVMLGAAGGATRPARRYTLPALVADVQVLDVTGDGILDIAATTQSGTTPSGRSYVLAGVGDGTFTAAAALFAQRVTDAAFGSLHSADIVDAAVITADGLAVLPGGGGSGFGAPLPVDVTSPQTVWAADLDADGVGELVVATSDRRLLRLDALEVTATAALTGAVTDVDFADATGDAAVELVVGTSDGHAVILDAALQELRREQLGGGAVTAAAGDIDGDGQPELVATARAQASLSIWRGDTRTALALARPATDVLVSDLTADGRGDVLAVEPDSSVIEVLADPLGTDAAPPLINRTFSGGYDTHVVDVDGDGYDDMVAANCWTFIGDTGGNFRAEVYRNDGTGTLTRSATLTAALPSSCGTAVGDVNGDGAADVLMTDYYSGAVHQWLGNGDATFGPATVVHACYFASDVVAADFNGDGTDDAAVACRTPSALAVLAGTPAGLARTPVTLPYGFGAETYLFDTGDLNGDGNVDLVVGSFNQTCPTVFCVTDPQTTGRPVTYFMGGGNLTFEPMRKYTPAGPFFTMDVADIDGDGHDDVITPLVFDDVVEIHRGSSTGPVADATTSASYDYPWGLAARDVTGDGNADLVMTHGPTLVSVTAGNGDGTFATPTGYVTRQVTGDVFTGLFDDDDRLDLLVVEPAGAEVLLQR